MPQTSQAFSSSASFEPRVGTPSREEFSHPSRRPTFSSSKTSDRLSESSRLPPRLSTVKTNFKKERRSVFKELGLDDEEINHLENKPISSSPSFTSTNSSKQPGTPNRKLQKEPTDNATPPPSDEKEKPSWYRRLSRDQRPRIKSVSSAPSGLATLPRVAMIAFLIALVIPTLLQKGPAKVPADGAVAGVIPSPKLVRREDSPTDTCTRWSHQSALVKGTVYIYGGQSKTSSGQQGNTWNNNFLTMDLTKSWDRTSPPLTGLPKPVGPPAVSNGYLWTSYESLYLYGGIYSDSPPAEPDPVSVWEYRIADQEWIEHASPETTGGNNSAPAGQPVGRSGEGAGLSIPELGLSYYFGGHQDLYTTQGWSNQIARIYLKSMLEFTHPGYMNTGVEGLGIGGSGAPENGAYRNITEGGLQDTAGFTERADGVLVYVPGWGESGIVLGLAGGTNATFTDINTIDIYDVATSTWYKQSTSGTAPSIRVNPCAVVFAAPDASSFNVYLYGGQNLIPYGEQVQKDDVWILSIPSFTWVQADTKDQSVPPARAGHTCHAWDGQMVVVGGYVGQDLSCDSPGIYVFDASKLEWTNTFTAVEGSVPPASLEPNGIGSGRSRQTEGGDGEGDEGEEEGTGSLYAGLVGSNGYLVPEAVVAVIGGSPSGSATVTAPSIVPTEGPIATGKPPVFTITAPGTTVTSAPTGAPGSPGSSGAQDSGPNKPAIIAGVIAGVLGLVAAYLAFCTWLYRRQLRLYKDHVAMAQRAQFNNSPNAAGMHEKTHTNLHSSGGPGAPVVGAFGTVLSPGTARASDDPQGRSSLGSSAGGQLGGGLARPEFAKLQQDSNVTRATGGTTDEGYLAGLSGEGSQSGGRRSGSVSSEDDLLGAMEPSFISVVMSPRRTLRVINRD